MKFVQINSTQTITVTPGLQHLDATNYDSDVPNRLRVSATWPKATVQITAGIGLYPAEIAEWNTVKALVKDQILTISGFTDKADEETEKKTEELEMNLEEIQPKKTTKRKTKSLEEITEE